MGRDSERQQQDLQGWLQTRLGDHLVFAEPSSGCIGLLNPLATWILEARDAQLSDTEIATSLADQFSLDAASARKDVEQVVAMQAELLQRAQYSEPREKKPVPVNDMPIPFTANHTLQLKLGLYTTRFEAQSTELFASLEPCIEHLVCKSSQTDGLIQLRGTPGYWQLVLNGEVVVDGTGSDDAVCSTII